MFPREDTGRGFKSSSSVWDIETWKRYSQGSKINREEASFHTTALETKTELNGHKIPLAMVNYER
jgi:hypothetical protein